MPYWRVGTGCGSFLRPPRYPRDVPAVPAVLKMVAALKFATGLLPYPAGTVTPADGEKTFRGWWILIFTVQHNLDARGHVVDNMPATGFGTWSNSGHQVYQSAIPLPSRSAVPSPVLLPACLRGWWVLLPPRCLRVRLADTATPVSSAFFFTDSVSLRSSTVLRGRPGILIFCTTFLGLSATDCSKRCFEERTKVWDGQNGRYGLPLCSVLF